MSASAPAKRALDTQLFAILAIALLVRVALVLAAPFTTLYPDETFQVLEPAHRLVFGYGIVTWEWHVGIRSWVLPGLLSPVFWLGSVLHLSSITTITIIRILFSALSLTWVWTAYTWARRIAGPQAALLAGIFVALWPDIVLASTHTLNETFAAFFVVPALLMLFRPAEGLSKHSALLCGFALSFGILARIQLAPLLLYAVIYLLLRRRSIALQFFFGAAIAFAIFGAVDWATWGLPFKSAFFYFHENITHGRAAAYGIEPWYWFGRELLKSFGPLLLLALPAIRRDKHLAANVALVIFFHSLISHKEQRYLFPIYPLLGIMIVVGLWELARRLPEFKSPPLRKFSSALLLSIACLLIVGAFCARQAVKGTASSSTARLMNSLSHASDLCGVELLGAPWWTSGGYTLLHRPVPVSYVNLDKDASAALGAPVSSAQNSSGLTAASLPDYANYVIAKPESAPAKYTQQKCAKEVCLYHRPGTCAALSNSSAPDGYLAFSGNTR